MRLTVNGKPAELDAAVLGDVLRHYELQGKLVVAEVDGMIVDKSVWEDTPLSEGMRIELVHFVGGG
ncbi:sulfur carrier protein ThiS [Paenibacillus sp. 1P07SE]|uniref:sulfur carrier protein ThiS n=1 Tax=Paenibacillus sp. 1P07SE TaxID=3132209 RepID=UPI0039A5BEEE